ncbi:MAG: aminotransferase class I/II-fold pyridoxal phosphate-dependent enzyme [Candidatus Marinimicrobia bacterium]|nr:aminotransferase class I/II-fold pyridoxal phosphate-dependent enzyme [Candidatus Neomarinimicrobiota bacterium]
MFLEFKDIAKQKAQVFKQLYFKKHPDVFTKMYNFTRANTARAFGYYPYFQKIEVSDGTEVTIDGQKKIMLGSNNYLGLTNHPEVIEAGVDALRKYGSGLTGSRFLNGNIVLHEILEAKLADFVGKENALVFSTGFNVNLGVISTTVEPSDLIFIDAFNHASIVDGSRFSKARIVKFKHNDMADLEKKLANAKPDKARFITADGIFSMEGDVLNLPDLVRLAKKYEARIMIDEAHSVGVMGPNGEGVVGHYNLADKVDLIMGTFSKSLAGVGGFIAGNGAVIDYLKHHTRAMIFTAALPASNVATVMKALEIIKNEPERRKQLWDNTDYMTTNFRQIGYDTGESTTPIIPLIIGDEKKTFLVWKDLMREGVYTNPVITPAVPRHRSLLRTSYMATHTREQLDFCLDKFLKIGKKHGIINGATNG